MTKSLMGCKYGVTPPRRVFYLGGVPVGAEAIRVRWLARGTQRDAVHPLGVGDASVGFKGLVVACAVGGREQLDVAAVVALDRAGLGVLDTEALSVSIIDTETEVLGARVVLDDKALVRKGAGAECELQHERLVHCCKTWRVVGCVRGDQRRGGKREVGSDTRSETKKCVTTGDLHGRG